MKRIKLTQVLMTLPVETDSDDYDMEMQDEVYELLMLATDCIRKAAQAAQAAAHEIQVDGDVVRPSTQEVAACQMTCEKCGLAIDLDSRAGEVWHIDQAANMDHRPIYKHARPQEPDRRTLVERLRCTIKISDGDWESASLEELRRKPARTRPRH